MAALIVSFTTEPETALAEFESGRSALPSRVNLTLLPEIWISVAAAVKRCHDRGKTGFWYLIAFIPIIGPIWQLVELGFLPGERSVNDHGNAPDAARFQQAVPFPPSAPARVCGSPIPARERTPLRGAQ